MSRHRSGPAARPGGAGTPRSWGASGSTSARGSGARRPCPRRGPGPWRPGRYRCPGGRAAGRAFPRDSQELRSPERLDPVAELGGLLEVEPPRRLLHPCLQLGDSPRERRGRLELLLGGRLHLDRVVVPLVDRLEELAGRRPDRLGRDAVLPGVGGLELAAPFRPAGPPPPPVRDGGGGPGGLA